MALNFPDSPTLNQVYSAGGKTWSYNGSRWVLVIATAIIDVADGSITAAKIADGTIVAAEIANSAITTAKINNNAVTQAKLASNLSAVTVTTTANRDTDIPSPFTGQLAVLTDTKKIQLYDGTSWVNVSLAPPETPTSLSATALSTTSVSIAFTAGGANGSPITNYKYALSTNGGSTYGSFVALDPVDITSPITISGLTAGTTYYIKLKAVNDMGDSVASAAVSVSTLATPDAPTSLSATPSSTSVSISFTPGAQGGSAITNYQYALSTNGGSTYGSFTALDPADATSPITISGLSQGTAYYVKLKGVNTDGAGAESNAVSFTTFIAVDYLVVAGGGSGASHNAGGGGAGGLRSTVTTTGGGGSLESPLAITLSTNYTVEIGAGGVGVPDQNGNNGGNSVFSTITSVGGGRGVNQSTSTGGITGGSGGGAMYSGASGAGTANQGFAGGLGDSASGGGGGGGAGAVGSNGTSVTRSNGGAGVLVTIDGNSYYYAGGGGGSAYSYINSGNGGIGGGGGGGQSGENGGTAGTGGGSARNSGGSGTVSSNSDTGGAGGANTGGGGGGTNRPTYGGGTGGSGIVILRYPSAYTITIGAGLTGSTTTVSSNKVTTITAGSGNVSWA